MDHVTHMDHSYHHYISVLVTFVLIDPETNRTLTAIEAITILQRGDAQAALLSDDVQAISAFAVAGKLVMVHVNHYHICNHVKTPHLLKVIMIVTVIVVSSLHKII